MSERSIFLRALDTQGPAQRSTFLDMACAGDDALRQRVEALLKSHVEAGSFLNKLAPERVAEELAILQTGGETQDESPANDEIGDDLGFLSPSDQPGVLGRLGHYEVREVIGRGSMGIVLRAFDDQLHRIVALKVMAPQLATNATARKRFVREAQAAAAVRDEHVVTIHAVEEANGLPYLVMEYVAGVSLQERLDRSGPLELKEILRVGLQIAIGLAAAHAQGLIHRDVKPANILLENGVERVRITDFGLARAVDDVSLTQRGMIAGTPQYMAPEQACGEAVDHRADLFGLGSVLYALCTGRAPFRGSGTMAVLKSVCEDTPRPIQESHPETPAWLVAIIARLHAKDPADRFQSAAEVAELLSKHLAHLQQPALGPLPAVRPSPAPPPRRGARGRGRRWAAVLLFLVVGLSLTEATGVTHLVATVIRIFTPDGTLVVEVDDPGVKVTIEGDGGILITGSGPQEVRLRPGNYKVRATKDGKPVRPEELITITRGAKRVVKVSLEAAATTAKERQPAGAQASVLQQQPLAPGEVRRFVGHTSGINGLAISRDGRRILSGACDRTLRLWDIETGREIRRFEGHTGAVSWVALSPDGHRALSSSGWPFGDKTLCYWDVDTGKELPFWRLRGVWGAAFSPDGLRVLTSDSDWSLRLRELASGKEVQRFVGHTEFTQTVDFSPNGRLVLSGSADETVRLWDAETGRELRRFDGHTDKVWCVNFSPDGRRALSCAADATLRLWDIETGKEIRRFEQRPLDCFTSEAFSPDGRYALSGGFLGVRLWDVETGKLLHQFKGHTARVENVAFTPDGRYAVSAGNDGDNTIRLWELPQEVRPRRSLNKVVSGTFVVLNGKGVPLGKFDTLTDAVSGAGDGDAIEVCGNGPFVSEPIRITQPALTIRAGAGFRPVIKLSSEAVEAKARLLETPGVLVVEGLEFQRMARNKQFGPMDSWLLREGSSPWPALLQASKGLYVANCRLLTRGTHSAILSDGAVCVVRNCELLCSECGFSVYMSASTLVQRLVVDNCLATESARIAFWTLGDKDWTLSAKESLVQLSRSTWRTERAPFWFLTGRQNSVDPVKPTNERVKVLRVEAAGNVFDGGSVFYWHCEPYRISPESLLTSLVRWKGEGNVFAGNGPLVELQRGESNPELISGMKTLPDWRRFWGTAEANSIRGVVRYRGDDLLGKVHRTPEQLTPADFRLRPDSAGYRAGKDRKDLGANLDLVGPGKAYERWKKTPEYQLWLKETRQLKEE